MVGQGRQVVVGEIGNVLRIGEDDAWRIGFYNFVGEVGVCNLEVIVKDCNVIIQLESLGLSARATDRSRWKLGYLFRISCMLPLFIQSIF